MTKINPPLTRGERRQPTQGVMLYKTTVVKLDTFVKRKNTSRIEYLRWLIECADAGLVGPVEDANLKSEHDDFVTAMLDGQMTRKEALGVLGYMLRRACIAQRAHDEKEWSGANDAS